MIHKPVGDSHSGFTMAPPSTLLARMRRSMICRLARHVPGLVHRRASAAARSMGIDDLFMVVSFDCDTERDFDVVEELVQWLADRDVPAVLAVPGELLKRGATVFRSLADSVGEFINHGYREHTVYKGGAYEPTLFYHLLPASEVVDDIIAGHESLESVLGITPGGFRAPHFGTIRDPARLELIRGVLLELGYGFSSSTMPEQALLRGPLYDAGGFVEFPLTGTWDRPLVPLDSWGFRVSETGYFQPDEFEIQFAKLLRYYKQRQLPGLLNIYVDPSQVWDFPPFFKSVELALEHGVTFVTYSDLLRKTKESR